MMNQIYKYKIIISVLLMLFVSGCSCNIKFEEPKKVSSKAKHENFEQINAKAKKLIYDKEVVWDAFSHIAFGTEFRVMEKERRESNKIKKWERPIRVDVVGENVNRFKPIVEGHVEKLKKILPMRIKMLEPKKDALMANIIICFTRDFKKAIFQTYRRDIEKIYKEYTRDKDYLKKSYLSIASQQNITDIGSSFGDFLAGLGPDIWFGVIFIRSDAQQDRLYGTVEEELIQGLGLFNDYPGFKYTSFSDGNKLEKMTSLDWFLLKILYHEKMKMGFTLKQARQVFDEVYYDLIKKEG